MVRIRQIKDRRITWGFSLIELLIVIILIGLLSVIGFGYYQTYLMKGRDSQRKSDLQQIRSGLEMYRADTNSYPIHDPSPSWKIVACGTSCTTPCNWNEIWSCNGSTYMQKLPKNPKGLDYRYGLAGSAYTLEVCLENASDTGDNVVDVSKSYLGFSLSNCSTNKVYQLFNP